MKTLSLQSGLEALSSIRERFRKQIETEYESKAKDCVNCEVQGICCTDDHFVNVRITRLEAEAIYREVNELTPGLIEDVKGRTEGVLRESCPDEPQEEVAFYACPLFESGVGCLVHATAKPLPCIHQACYEVKEDLPPDTLLESAETRTTRLNQRVFGNSWGLESIPEAIGRRFLTKLKPDQFK